MKGPTEDTETQSNDKELSCWEGNSSAINE